MQQLEFEKSTPYDEKPIYSADSISREGKWLIFYLEQGFFNNGSNEPDGGKYWIRYEACPSERAGKVYEYSKFCEDLKSCHAHAQSIEKVNEYVWKSEKCEQYKKECTEERKQFRKDAEISAVKMVAMCMKECVIAEAATITGKTKEAWTAMLHGNNDWQKAKMYAEISHAPGDTKPNTADIAASNAGKQLNKTAIKNRKFLNKIISTNQTKELGAA